MNGEHLKWQYVAKKFNVTSQVKTKKFDAVFVKVFFEKPLVAIKANRTDGFNQFFLDEVISCFPIK